MKISIVIPTLNEEKYLPKLLQSIRQQTFNDYEIIVADAGSTDATCMLAKKYGARVVKGGMPAAGRNAGAKVATGEFLFFFDADVKIPKTFLKKAYDEMQNRYLDLATCEIKPLSNLLIDKVMHDFANTGIKLAQYNQPHAPGFCIFVSKRLFDHVDGFDESIKLAEDHDFVKRASKIRPLRVLSGVTLYVSVRRLRKEGRFVLIGKYAKAELFRYLQGELKTDIVEYEFANFNTKSNKPLEKKLLLLEKKINKINLNYNKMKKKIEKSGIKQKPITILYNQFKNSSKTLRNSFKNVMKKKQN